MPRLYAVMLDAPDTDINRRLAELFEPDNAVMRISDTSVIVRTDQSADDLIAALGIGDPPEDTSTGGVVFSLNGVYRGFFAKRLWEWMRQDVTSHAR